jgi:putative addiction module component (TIGR02574 family)
MESLTVETIIKNALEKSETDRARIAEILISSLEETPDSEVEKAWQEEIASRIHEVDSGKVKCIPWEEIRDRLNGKTRAES